MSLSKLCVLSVLLALQAHRIHGLALPSDALIDRRKSPALWRYDLQPKVEHGQGIQDGGDDSVPGQNGESMKPRRILTAPPEVMAPVGGFPQLEAAIGNGADSVYLGLSAFSARARATNFDPETQLPKAVAMAHDANVKVYVALNTLIFDHELVEVETLVRQCARAKVDALIVQDLGLARMVRDIAPSLEVHASTQQTITSSDGAAFIAELVGTTRVVLGRELSTKEIDLITADLDEGIEIETFVHGALCVSYSGQCFSSEAWGGRSANRGQCAQACRLPYGLIDNGELKELGDFSYLLSPQDLCGIDSVSQLVESGVSCLKIEGRLKDPAYVAATTRAYRNAVDEAWEAYCEKHLRGTSSRADISTHKRRRLASDEMVTKAELAQVFSRGQDEDNDGLTPGFFDGSKHQTLVRGRSPRHRGVHVGRVISSSSWKNGLAISTDDAIDLKRGDGIVVDRGMAQDEELGGAIFDVIHGASGSTIVRFSRDTEKRWKKHDEMARKGLLDGKPLAPAGAHVWRTNDADVDKKMRRLSQSPAPLGLVTVAVVVRGKLGGRLVVTINDGCGNIGTGISQGDLVPAERSALSLQSISKAIGMLGNTGWVLEGDASVDVSEVDDGVWCPVSWIKEARRQAVDDLQSQIEMLTDDQEHDEDIKSLNSRPPEHDGTPTTAKQEAEEHVSLRMLRELHARRTEIEQQPSHSASESAIAETADTVAAKQKPNTEAKLSVLARNFDQVDAICVMAEEGHAIDEIVVDFLEVDGMRDAVARIRSAGVTPVVASPRIIKPGESGIWRTLLRLEADGLLVRSAGLLYRMMKLGGPGKELEVGDGNGNNRIVKIPHLIGDFSLNASNAITAWELLKYGCGRITAAYDLSAMAISEMLDTMGEDNAARVELVAHTHLPIFHTEHCVFARFLTKGDSYLDCGHACTRHNIHLRDQTGADNLVLADMGCRNTVFSAQAQSGVHSMAEWADAGARHFRVELVDESPEDSQLIVSGYLSVLQGTSKPKQVWESLETVRDSNGRMGGVSHGSLRNVAERRAGEL